MPKHDSKIGPPDFLKSQIITYMGNKRKVLPHIDYVMNEIKTDLNKNTLKIGDGFAGSGIVSRLGKMSASELYTNDLAGYTRTLNNCYLATPTKKTYEKICEYIDEANKKADDMDFDEPWISKHWTGERAYYTETNGKRIDAMRQYIETIPKNYRDFVLAPLLVECSMHTNTSGQFASYYKGGYGGKTGTDVKRITQDIRIPYPIFDKNKCKVKVSQMDTTEWVQQLPNDLDVVYYDPPYNKHPYNIYYFLLDIINNYDTSISIPESYRGQPDNRTKSDYNSSVHAEKALFELLLHTKSKYILMSYNNKGIIPVEKIEKFLKDSFPYYKKISFSHNTYNRLIGLSGKPINSTTEQLFLIKTF